MEFAAAEVALLQDIGASAGIPFLGLAVNPSRRSLQPWGLLRQMAQGQELPTLQPGPATWLFPTLALRRGGGHLPVTSK